MVRPTIEETRMFLFLALATLLIIVICGTTQFTNAYVATNTKVKTYSDPAGFFYITISC
jgi:hypothetical protein